MSHNPEAISSALKAKADFRLRSPICEIIAVDAVGNGEIPVELYQRFIQLHYIQHSSNPKVRNQINELKQTMLESAGFAESTFVYAETSEEFEDTVNKSLDRGFGVLIFSSSEHVFGVLRDERANYALISSKFDGINLIYPITIDQIYESAIFQENISGNLVILVPEGIDTTTVVCTYDSNDWTCLL